MMPLLLLAVLAACSVPEWECTATNSINRLPPRTYTMPLASEQDALTDELEPNTPYRLSLNGEWKMSWSGNPALRARRFWEVGFDDSDWFRIDVPSCVELRGFGVPGYTNSEYPHANRWPRILDRLTEQPDFNPVSSYRRTFVVPEGWKDRRVILRFDGVGSAYYVWVNGQKVGYAEDSKLPSEFDITPYLNLTIGQSEQSNNVLAVEVYKWCDGSYLEDQDMIRFSGIFRDVTLWSMPRDGIWDFAVQTKLENDYRDAALAVEGVDGVWTAALYDEERNRVAAFSSESNRVFVTNVRLWSSEKSYLYTLVLKKGDDIRMRRIGFKEQKTVGNKFLVNGRAIKFKGVNRHEASPENGRSVTIEEMTKDVEMMKRHNINMVRTAHYPNHHLWYDLCDRYGLYLCAEANVEGHEPGYGKNGLGRFPEWDHSIVERNVRHVIFYRNHPSVTMWSVGNETGHGDCFRHAIAAVRHEDPTRPVHWQRGNPDADVDSGMYKTVDWLLDRGRFGDGQVAEFPRDGKDENRQTANKVFFLCEYAHAMGNALGNFAEYWDAFYRFDSLCGGCVWDWVDQAVWKTGTRIDGKTGRREKYLAYGGDYDEFPNFGPFNCDGLVDPLRRVSAKLIEAAHVHRNLVVTRKPSGAFELWNRFGFTSADEFCGVWKLRVDGKVVQGESFAVPPVPPLSRAEFSLPDLPSPDGKETFVEFEFSLRNDTLWAKRGWVVARDQIALSEWTCESRPYDVVMPHVEESSETVTASFGATKAVFSRRLGTLCELSMNGRRVLSDDAGGEMVGPRLSCVRAFTDNDVWMRGRKPTQIGSFYASGLTQPSYHARPIAVSNGVVRCTVVVTGAKSAGFTHESEWAFLKNGGIVMKNTVVPHGTMPVALPRLGLSMNLDADLSSVTYYGRGPRENYIDRKSGSFVGVWSMSVDEMGEFYVRPQDNGYRSDVRWASFVDGSGRGVRFSASEPLFVQALRADWEDLEFARHREGQQRHRTVVEPTDDIRLNLDIRQLGLGNGSCIARPLDRYVFPIRKEKWILTIEPTGGLVQ